ncbi:MAG: hypothetical protein BA871_09080 [Desulfuromonadales bacterium C00003096]|jgi:hypothetical protein|nr:MAG: hypothetical protein BA871_09080 [Desulfuromonadales bacterium C00003096]
MGRNEKLAVRDQIFEILRANSRAILRKLSRIWADQAILQSAHGKPDSLLARSFRARSSRTGDGARVIDRGIEYAKYQFNIRTFAVNPEGKCLEDCFREKSTAGR